MYTASTISGLHFSTTINRFLKHKFNQSDGRAGWGLQKWVNGSSGGGWVRQPNKYLVHSFNA